VSVEPVPPSLDLNEMTFEELTAVVRAAAPASH
jgi:hypothetical protein